MSAFRLFRNAIIKTRLGERGGSVVECRTPEREVRGSRSTAAVLCPWARHFTPRKYWLITQEAMAPSRHDWKIVDWDVKPQHNQPKPVYKCGHNIQFVEFVTGLDFSPNKTSITLLFGLKGWLFSEVSNTVGEEHYYPFKCRLPLLFSIVYLRGWSLP